MQERRVAPALNDARGFRRDATRRLVLAGAVAAIVVAADQTSKSWAVHRLPHGPIHVVWKLDLQLTYNTGGAFSFARGWAPVLAGVAIVIVLVLLGVLRRVQSAAMAVALGLVVGGALGNLVDRVARANGGAVIDFVALHFWPTFNVADACIVVGGVMAGVLLWRDGRRAADPGRAH
jgi:signal peptidase II